MGSIKARLSRLEDQAQAVSAIGFIDLTAGGSGPGVVMVEGEALTLEDFRQRFAGATLVQFVDEEEAHGPLQANG